MTKEETKQAIWRMWRSNFAFVEIWRAVGGEYHQIREMVIKHGGIRPRERHRRVGHLSLEERESISRGLAKGDSLRKIAGELGRSPSTISREVARNGGRERYRATEADEKAWKSAERPKGTKLSQHPELRAQVVTKLELDWSPQQIAEHLKVTESSPSMRVSHETIYRSLYVQTRGALKKHLTKHLRRAQKYRKAKRRRRVQGTLRDIVPISERPAAANDRAVPGHWEGDLIAGAKGSYLITLVERASRFVLLGSVNDRTSLTVTTKLASLMKGLPAALQKSVTWDRGREMAKHKDFTMATDIQVFFCDPYSPWQRGSNENTNGLLRQYFPKGMNLRDVTDERLREVENRLNERPRQTLGWKCPKQKLASMLR